MEALWCDRCGESLREADHFDVALVKLWLDLGDIAKLGGANRCEIFWMTKQHAPRVAEPVVKLDLALGGLGGEVWGNVSETN